MTRRIIGPFNRVEGDLEVRLDIAAGKVEAARVSASMYRGFEQILHGRPMMDAISINPRICGICSVSQSVATADALADLLGIVQPENGRLGINLVHAAENLADHLTHFYLFFMPDFTRAVYGQKPWFDDASARFAAKSGRGQSAVLAARARLLNITGILVGKWPHTLAIQPGGLTHAPDEGACMRLKSVLADTRTFLQDVLFGQPLEHIANLEGRQALGVAIDTALAAGADFGRFGRIARNLSLEAYGQGYTRFMSFGAYLIAGEAAFAPGMMDAGTRHALRVPDFAEELSHSWYSGEPAHPEQGETHPDADREGAYSWSKAPRVAGEPVEVGAIARQVVAGHSLMLDLVGGGPANVYTRIVARMVESARIVLLMEDWVRRLEPLAPVNLDTPHASQQSGSGVGLVEAARGSLGHWVRIEAGRIEHYQIIAPTTWNFSPRDGAGKPGAVEYALEGTPVADGDEGDAMVQHVVRSFDPCMACTVH
ncbi:MAG: nickel-dependent hydrogenase large subunit [Rhodospirillales bacterium]|nr:nickel-dependent hydrogenase large subunit [Rhodospirillales bacterium]